MKDLKHLLYFENLLQEAQNELILQAQSEGKVCVAYVCENTPEPLLNLPGAFSTRLRAPRTGSMEMATYYMTSFLCEYSRALLERAIEGGYNFADCLITPDGCTMMNRAVENMELLKALGKDKEKFFFEYMEIPMKADDNGLNLYTLQCKNHILKPLHEHYGIDVSDKAIRQAVAEHNRVCELIRAIGAEPVAYSMRNECCGGYIALEDAESARKKSSLVANSAANHGAEMIVTACPLCRYNLEKNGSPVPVVYITELLAEALGVKED